VALTGERYGSRLIVDMLRGNKNERVERLGLDRLTPFGASGRQTRQLREMIDYLVTHKYLEKTNDEYSVIKLGARADEVLRGGASVQMKLSVSEPTSRETRGRRGAATENIWSAAAKTGDGHSGKSGGKSAGKNIGGSVDKGLFEVLRKLRAEIAAEQKVPAFVIFADSALNDMCVKIPKTRTEFLNVSGVGNVKLERFGDKFLKAIAAYSADKGHL